MRIFGTKMVNDTKVSVGVTLSTDSGEKYRAPIRDSGFSAWNGRRGWGVNPGR